MANACRETYKGWDVQVFCTHQARHWLSLKHTRRFSAVGLATLREDLSAATDWIDPRPQTVTLGERVFATGVQCTDVLMDEIKMLIDALQREKSTPDETSATEFSNLR
jgi:hypothetical protein